MRRPRRPQLTALAAREGVRLTRLCDYGVIGLDEAFVAAAREAYDVLLSSPECERYLHDLHKACTL